jgi:hypothetical protein
MQFTILKALWATLYIAVALASFRYSTPYLTYATHVICNLTFAGVAVLAFERRSTPLFSFVVFGLAATFTDRILTYAVLPVMLALGTPTGSNEYNNLASLLTYHALIVFGITGYGFGAFVVACSRKANAKSPGDE